MIINKDRPWASRLAWITFVILVIFFGIRTYYRITDDFRISHMTYDIPHNPAWDTFSITRLERAGLHQILDQPFTYVGKGAQSYVFVSEDKNYVIKFFKFKHLKPNWIVDSLPDIPYFSDYRDKQAARKERLLNSVFDGYKLAYDVHREETGLVFLHLNRTENLGEIVTLYDKIGREYTLELDPIVFVIQEAAKTSRQILSDALDQGHVSLARHRMHQIFDLYLQEYQKGIYDRDHGVLHNTGFVGEKPIHLDVGKLTKEPEMKKLEVFKPDLIKIGHKFEVWLKNHYPQYYTELTTDIEQIFTTIFDESFSFH